MSTENYFYMQTMDIDQQILQFYKLNLPIKSLGKKVSER